MFPIPVKGEIDPVLPECKVGTDIIVHGLLPSQICIAQGIQDDSRTEHIGHPAVELVGGESLICREILIARISD